MDIDLQTLSPHQAYFTLIQTLVPRPIAWVLSENAQGRYNLAPFSYFSAVSSDPPLIMLSVSKKSDGSWKDTRVNIEQRREFVVHMVHRALLDPMCASSAELPAEVSEVERLGLALTPFGAFRLPRLRDCRIAYACSCYQIHDIGPEPQALILGQVHAIHIDDAICTQDAQGRLKVLADRLDPLARLGADEYAGLGPIIHAPRP